MGELVVRQVRVVPLDAAPSAPGTEPVDLLLRDGRLTAVGPGLPRPAGAEVLEADGRWVVPGLWDHHVHAGQLGATRGRLDLSAARSPREAAQRVRERLAAARPLPATGVLTGWGHRADRWAQAPTRALLDEASPRVPVVLISADGHHGWLNSTALTLLGGPCDRSGLVREAEWFALYDRLNHLPRAQETTEQGVREVVAEAHRLGIVGITDLELGRPWVDWPRRLAEGVGPLRVRTGVYVPGLDEVEAAGLRTGDALPGTEGLVRMGPLKLFGDGSLGTRTAWCRAPYADAPGRDAEGRGEGSVGGSSVAGAPQLTSAELHDLLGRARMHGLEVAVHAIGDAAVGQALAALAATGVVGSVEHAQLVGEEELARWRGLPVRAGVQPAHLLDDRSAAERAWPDRTGQVLPLRRLVDAGVELAMGSDAPFGTPDPWLAVAAAVHRARPGEDPWHPELALTPREALAASVDGQRVRAGARGDLVLLDADPLGADLAAPTSSDLAARLERVGVAATVVAGRVVHQRES